jgi:hypothetical protein
MMIKEEGAGWIMGSFRSIGIILALAYLVVACKPEGPSRPETWIRGMVVPANSKATIIVFRDGNEINRALVDPERGDFSLKVDKGGLYDIKVIAEGHDLPLYLYAVDVKEGEVHSLNTLIFSSSPTKGVLQGRIFPSESKATVRVFAQGKEKATATIDERGTFRIKDLPYGEYFVRITSEAYSPDSSRRAIVISEGSKEVNISTLLFLRTPVEGVQWDDERIFAKGFGRPPKETKGAAQAKILAKRAAMVDGYRNLLSVIEQLRISMEEGIGDLIRKNRIPNIMLEGFVKGAVVEKERYFEDGSCELLLWLPLAGERGLSDFVLVNIEDQSSKGKVKEKKQG